MKQEEADRIYKELRKDLTDEEIAESFIFSIDMTDEDVRVLQEGIQKRQKRISTSEMDDIKKRIDIIIENEKRNLK